MREGTPEQRRGLGTAEDAPLRLKPLNSQADKTTRMILVCWRMARGILLIALLGGLMTATLVRLAPGYGLSEEQLDPRRSESSLRQAESTRGGDESILGFYLRFLLRYARGDLGHSPLFQRPVRELIAERIPPTTAALMLGLAGGWLLALAVGVPGGMGSWPLLNAMTRTTALLLQSIPAAVLGLLVLLNGARGARACGAAVALALYPRLVQYVMNLVSAVSGMPHVLAARAKGVGSRRILGLHVMPVVLPEFLALAGVSVSMALSVAIPLEMILDVAGIGQLTWQAALGRDMNLLVNLTVLISLVITFANALAARMGERPSTVEARGA